MATSPAAGGWRGALTTAAALITRRGDLAVVALVIAVIALMVLPIPPALLDTLIAINIAASIGLLMLAVYVKSPLALSTFPSLLLFTTLLRLSLNIATTKQILLHAHAGHIIETFGKLVVGGNVVVGLVVFVIIATVQFIVIAKGSERVAEVGARFTLDGMPGKQMSIDADLRSGLVNKEEARRRRRLLEEESQFHGAMDGAMKFVKGDAIAGLIIAFVNVVAGIAVGAFMKDMPLGEATRVYTILAVGDGMVSQIPSLFVSIAAGVLITRVGGEEAMRFDNLGGQISRQILDQPVAMLLTGTILLGFVLMPGFPKLQFAIIGAAIGGMAWLLLRAPNVRRSFENTPMPSMKRDGELDPPTLVARGDPRSVVLLGARVATDFAEYVQPAALDAEFERCGHVIRRDLGTPFPGIRIRYDAELPPGAYVLEVHELPRAEGRLRAGRFIEGASGGTPGGAAGDDTAVPAIGPFAAGHWRPVDAAEPPAARAFSAEQVLARHIEWLVLRHPDQFIGFQETQHLIEELGRSAPDLAQEVLRNVPLQRITDVLRRLVQEGISIRPLREILESLIVWGPREKDPVLLTEYVRIDLGRYTAYRHSDGAGLLRVLLLAPGVEDVIRKSVQQTSMGSYVALGPDETSRLHAGVRRALARLAAGEPWPVLAVSMDVRRYVRRLLEAQFGALSVLSFQELGSHVTLQPAGQVTLDQV